MDKQKYREMIAAKTGNKVDDVSDSGPQSTEEFEKPQIGLSAQELEQQYPELVIKGKDTGLMAVDYSRLSVVLLEALKEQQQQIEALLVRINDLEKKGK